MGELILCKQGVAGIPYYIEQNMVNIYSVEELCYFLLNSPEILEDSLITEELCSWFETELKMKQLAQQLRDFTRQPGALIQQVKLILDSNGFCSKVEKSQIEETLRDMENKSETECKKLRADRNLKNQKYVAAIREYMGLLQMEDMKKADAKLTGNIWNNIGVAYTGMFLYQEAGECFDKAYQYNNNPECLKEAETARRMEQEKADIAVVPEGLEIEAVLTEGARYQALRKKDAVDNIYRRQLDKWKMIYEKNSKFS